MTNNLKIGDLVTHSSESPAIKFTESYQVGLIIAFQYDQWCVVYWFKTKNLRNLSNWERLDWLILIKRNSAIQQFSKQAKKKERIE